MALRDRETREKASGRLVRREQRGWIVESEGWGKMVEKEEEESAMAKGLKLEVTIDEAIAEEVWEREIGIRRGTQRKMFDTEVKYHFKEKRIKYFGEKDLIGLNIGPYDSNGLGLDSLVF